VQTSVIYCGDCQRVLPQALPDASVDLVYVDPPFFTSRNYEVLWGDGYELRAFEDRWKGGIENYIAWMEPKMRECFRVLKPTGVMYLHCDWHADAHLRILMDQIFRESNLVNEIIWVRQASHGDTKQGAKHFGRLHDVILLYAKGPDYKWNMEYRKYDDEYMEKFYRNVEPDTGRRYMLDNIAGPGGAAKGNPYYEFMGVKRYWRYSKERMKELEKEGRIVQTSKGSVPRYKRYLDEGLGMPVQDVWTDIQSIQSQSKERLGYPTQKPEALLERIIKASSDKDDIVLDPMCGCGTAIAVAHKLGRRWIGIDVSPTACKLMAKRMRKLGVQNVKVEGLPKSLDEIRALQPFEFQNWVCQKVFAHVSERKIGDMGIDGWLMDGRPLQVKQSEAVGRNVIDNFETAIKRVKKNRGIIVALSFGKGAYEEVARVKNADGVEIELKTVEDIMREN
jgi:DNA modification methylase